jgi:hypothetical protein
MFEAGLHERVDLPTLLSRQVHGGCTYLKEVRPGVHAYALRQAMNRVRAHHAAVLDPLGARAGTFEYVLIGHIHVNDGKVALVEGFNGYDGTRWAERAYKELERAGALAANAELHASAAIRNCDAAMNPNVA